MSDKTKRMADDALNARRMAEQQARDAIRKANAPRLPVCECGEMATWGVSTHWVTLYYCVDCLPDEWGGDSIRASDRLAGMCGRYRLTVSFPDLLDVFSQTKIPLVSPIRSAAPNMEPREQVRPTDPAPILRPRAEGDGLEMVPARWWLVPRRHAGTFKDRPKLTTFNARAETVATSRTFREAFAQRRCLVPADGWYEWTGEKGSKTMWLFTPKAGAPLFFAGLWERFQDPEAGATDTFTIVTQPAGAPLNGYHDRAPVVLDQAARETWLAPDAEIEHLTALLGPESPDAFDVSHFGGPAPV